jgi:hypothetical protein
MEVLNGVTPRAQLIAQGLENELKTIKSMDVNDEPNPDETTEQQAKKKATKQKALGEAIKALREKVTEYMENHFCWNPNMVNDKDNYDLLQKLLIQINKRQDGLNIRRFAGRSVEENESANKKFTSE